MAQLVMIVANPNLSEMIRLLSISILLHELLNICNRGHDYVSQCVAPVFGLKLNPFVHSVIHVLLVIVAIGLSLTADTRLLPPMLLLLTLTIASYSIRLSNHLVVGWFFFLTLTIDFLRHGAITGASVFGIRGLVLLTYAFAVFHKLNHDYFSSTSSCGVRLFRSYFTDSFANLWTQNLVVVGGIWGPVIAEGTIPILLLFDRTRIVGVLSAICLHTLFGFARNTHFSVVMYAGLTVFLPPTVLSVPTVVIACALGAWIAFRYSMWKEYPMRTLALALHAVFGAIAGYMVVWTITTTGNSLDVAPQARVDWLVMSALFLLFALNALSPFYSSKTEFSLAMFSNMRPDRWSHLLVQRPRRHLHSNEYVEIVRMQGLPKLSSCPRASLAYKLVRAFTPYEGRKYLKYYLVESIKNLQTQLAPDFFVELTDGKQHFRISSSSDLLKLKHRKISFMPAVIPSDPRAPYCN
jgi:hypothetical protein